MEVKVMMMRMKVMVIVGKWGKNLFLTQPRIEINDYESESDDNKTGK